MAHVNKPVLTYNYWLLFIITNYVPKQRQHSLLGYMFCGILLCSLLYVVLCITMDVKAGGQLGKYFLTSYI